jgi:hypothetical protein
MYTIPNCPQVVKFIETDFFPNGKFYGRKNEMSLDAVWIYFWVVFLQTYTFVLGQLQFICMYVL